MSMHMRKSKVLEKMRNGEMAISVKLNLADARGVELAAMCGYDCIWIDLEHVPNNTAIIEETVRAAKIYDCDVLTRVSKRGYNDLIHPLEADSTGIAETRRLVAETAKKYGKFAGTTGSAKVIAEYRDMGYDFVNVISDVTALAQMYTAELEASKAALSK